MGDATVTKKYDGLFQKQVKTGIDTANAGDLIPTEEVEAKAKASREWLATEIQAVIDDPRPSTPHNAQ